MAKLLVLITTTIGSAIGWWLGSPWGMFTSFVLSVVGFAVGVWAGRRLFIRLGL